MKKIVFLADALEELSFKGDSSLALAEAALEKGDEVYWVTPEQLFLNADRLWLLHPKKVTQVNREKTPNYEVQDSIPLSQLDTLLIRKDPPFDKAFMSFCWQLSLETDIRFVNKPQDLLAWHEKSLQFRALAEGFLNPSEIVPSVVADNWTQVEAFLKYFEKSHTRYGFDSPENQWIVKPWLGYGGRGIQKCEDRASLQETLSKSWETEKTSYIVQPFLREIGEVGDRRVLFINGEYVGNFVRLPAPGKIESNLAQGGSALSSPLSDEQMEIMTRVGNFLKEKGIVFAGLDLISKRIGEINITSPTGIRNVQDLENPKFHVECYEKIMAR